MLYNKYRPDSFDTVVGQHNTVLALKKLVNSDEKFPNLILTGKHGTGKTSLARIIAKELGCSDIDIFELDAASNNTIENVRSIIQQCRIPPQNSKYKVYIIDEVHMFSSAGFDTLLKTLEEPPEYVVFILCTTEKLKLKGSIMSRCMMFNLNNIADKDIITRLKYVCDEECIKYEEGTLELIAASAEGSLRDALSYMEKCINFDNQLVYSEVSDNLNHVDYQFYYKVYDAILNHDTDGILSLVNEIILQGHELSSFIKGLSSYTRDLFVLKSDKNDNLISAPETLKKSMREQSKALGPATTFSILSMIDEKSVRFHLSNNKRLTVELLLINIHLLLKKKNK
jgi:DNA polymerase-3 subunit gamma/tau